jgi:hypothetical protein
MKKKYAAQPTSAQQSRANRLRSVARDLSEAAKYGRSAGANARSLLPGEVIAYRSAAYLLRREAQRVLLTESLRARA